MRKQLPQRKKGKQKENSYTYRILCLLFLFPIASCGSYEERSTLKSRINNNTYNVPHSVNQPRYWNNRKLQAINLSLSKNNNFSLSTESFNRKDSSQTNESSFQLTSYTKPQRIVGEIRGCATGYKKYPIILTFDSSNDGTVYVPQNDIDCTFAVESITLTGGTTYHTEEKYFNDDCAWDTDSVTDCDGSGTDGTGTAKLSSLDGSEMILSIQAAFDDSTISSSTSLNFSYTVRESGSSFSGSNNQGNSVSIYDSSLPNIRATAMSLSDSATPTWTISLECSKSLEDSDSDGNYESCHGIDITNDSGTDTYVRYMLIPSDSAIDLTSIEALTFLDADTTITPPTASATYTYTVDIDSNYGDQKADWDGDGTDSSRYYLVIKRRIESVETGTYQSGYLVLDLEYEY